MARTSSKAAVEETKTAAPVKEVKAAEPKKAVKKTAAKAAEKEAPVAEAPKKAEPKPVKKAEPKAAVKEEAPAAPATSVIFEYGEKKIVAKELLARAMEAFKAAHGDVTIQEMQLYVNADEGCAYIVVNGVEYPEDKIVF